MWFFSCQVGLVGSFGLIIIFVSYIFLFITLHDIIYFFLLDLVQKNCSIETFKYDNVFCFFWRNVFWEGKKET